MTIGAVVDRAWLFLFYNTTNTGRVQEYTGGEYNGYESADVKDWSCQAARGTASFGE